MEVGKKIRRKRVEAGLSQHELGARSGVSYSAISRIEAGKRSPTVTTLEKLAEALDTSLAEFFRRSP